MGEPGLRVYRKKQPTGGTRGGSSRDSNMPLSEARQKVKAKKFVSLYNDEGKERETIQLQGKTLDANQIQSKTFYFTGKFIYKYFYILYII